VRAELDALWSGLLDGWQVEGGAPQTARQIVTRFAQRGWARAGERGSWLLVRSWLLQRPAVRRVARDYWVLEFSLPGAPARTRLHVLPAFGSSGAAVAAPEGREEPTPGMAGEPARPSAGDVVPIPAELGSIEARWTATLRTLHLVEGFLPVPARHRCAYPPRAKQAGDWEVLRGKWFDTAEELWVWLDRSRDLLCGPNLADRLGWCEAGERIGVLWTADALVFRSLGVDEDVRREESRLADLDALAELRGGLGESYHRSLVALLEGARDGLTFPQLVVALCERQNHEVHRGTVRALLAAGGFVCQEGRWFLATGAAEGKRRLRRAMAWALVLPGVSGGNVGGGGVVDQLRDLANAVKSRLQRLTADWTARSAGTASGADTVG
jgi:hypothetical protein